MNIYPSSREAANKIVAEQARKAVKFAVRKVCGIRWHFTFDGEKYIITRADGGFVSALGTTQIEYNTRQLGTAKQWLQEYLEN